MRSAGIKSSFAARHNEFGILNITPFSVSDQELWQIRSGQPSPFYKWVSDAVWSRLQSRRKSRWKTVCLFMIVTIGITLCCGTFNYANGSVSWSQSVVSKSHSTCKWGKENDRIANSKIRSKMGGLPDIQRKWNTLLCFTPRFETSSGALISIRNLFSKLSGTQLCKNRLRVLRSV